MEYEEWRKLPKVELHCHLDGSLSREFIQGQLGREVLPSELTVSEHCESLAEYLEKFDLPLACIQSEDAMREAGYDFIRTAAKEQVRYVEVRFAPLLMLEDPKWLIGSLKSAGAPESAKTESAPGLMAAGKTQKDIARGTEAVLTAVLEGLEKGRKEFGVDSNIIVCAMRHHSEEENLVMLKSARAFLGEGVCAADLAGNEAAFPMKDFAELFAQVRRMEMPFTLHAGECGDAQNILDSIEAGAARIGHGIAMRGRKDIQDICRKKRIGIEMCPISNLQTKAVASPAEYPMREFLENGLLVTVNTDNRTVSNSSVAKELEFIQRTYGIRDEEILRMMKDAVEVSFADDVVKQKLWKELSGF